MSNMDTQAALDYHQGTNHPNGSLMDINHVWDPMNPPLPFKLYTNLEAVSLSLDGPPAGQPALSAIASTVKAGPDARIPSLSTLSRVLHFSAGITKTLRRPTGALPFRAAACTGALFHVELYLVCGDLPGLEAGVYHYDPNGSSLDRLRAGDFRQAVADVAGGEPSVAAAPATLIYTDVTWRNACKYQAREYRHAFWDCGTILANTLALASAVDIPASVVAGFADDALGALLGLDPRRELPLAMLPLGFAPDWSTPTSPAVSPLDLETLPISAHERDFPAIREMHAASSLAAGEEVASWRVNAPAHTMPPPTGRLTQLAPHAERDTPSDSIERIIVRRGSTRRFSHEPITFSQLSTALHRATQAIPADFLKPTGTALNDIYLLVNAVDGLTSGSYVFHRGSRSLELLREGDFRRDAGFLGLNQALAADAAVNIFLMAKLDPLLERFGNRGYRVGQLDASITAGRLYIAAYAQGFGATGLTFFDDPVTNFFSPHAEGKSVMFLVALGHRAR